MRKGLDGLCELVNLRLHVMRHESSRLLGACAPVRA